MERYNDKGKEGEEMISILEFGNIAERTYCSDVLLYKSVIFPLYLRGWHSVIGTCQVASWERVHTVEVEGGADR